MKLQLIDIVQSVLSAMDSDPVNSISDTEEAQQVAQVAEEIYYQLVDNNSKDWAFLKKVRELGSLSDVDRPNFLKIPDEVSEIYWIKYEITEASDDKRTYRTLDYCSPQDFLDKVHRRDTSQNNVIVVTGLNSVDMFIKNDEHPHFWTTFDDEYIVTDSFNSNEETTHHSSQSVAYVMEEPSFFQKDDFTPDLPSKMFPTYLAQVKTACFFYFKQSENVIDASAARRGRNVMLNKEYRANATSFRGYGRR